MLGGNSIFMTKQAYDSPLSRFLLLPVWLGIKPKLSSRQFTFITALFFVLFSNQAFWKASLNTFQSLSFGNIAFIFSMFIVLLALLNVFLSLICFRYIFKSLVIGMLISTSLASYFMDSYGVMLDGTMVQNVMQTDYSESFELLTSQLFYYLFLLGIFPSVCVLRIEVQYKTFARELWVKLWTVVVSLLVISALLFCFYQSYSSLARNNRYLRHLVNPVSYIYSLGSYIGRLNKGAHSVIKPLGEDAVLTETWKRGDKSNLVILVLGETARQMNFSLNGYKRVTNPLTSTKNIINYKNFYSCGTATAVSLPCLFSNLDRHGYSDAKAKGQEGLLDVLSHAGIEVLWRDNNSGCKEACDRVTYEKLSHLKVVDLCSSSECYDEILLYKLQAYLENLKGDAVIVLHQKGSHGPAYHLRYPPSFEKFKPVCATSQLQECEQQEIINAYDNTILYTDYFLAKTIDFLKANSARFNTAMIYISDHGESLGENNLYLHGLPYFIAPDEQKHVPFMVWFSDGFVANNSIDSSCLHGQEEENYSHDNIFHSMLGLMGVTTAAYEKKLDLFADCRG